MKILLTLLLSLFALSVQAQTTFEHFIVEDDWPAMNMIAPGEFFCTGGGVPVGMLVCEGGKGIHIRGPEMFSNLGSSQPYDWRLEGQAWWELNANWDMDFTGPIMGNWRIFPHFQPDNQDTYWEGTYTGKREKVEDTVVYTPDGPMNVETWIGTVKYVGFGFGALAGQKMKATETITTYGAAPMSYELLPGSLRDALGIGTGPEGVVEITIKSKK